jgi:protoporphyrin/coproporphyrin ferrochelatase
MFAITWKKSVTSSQNERRALLLINLGSPKNPTVPAVRRYLQEFLMDPFVIDIPAVLRALLVYGPISLFRAQKSAHAYSKVWINDTPFGAPLLHYSERAYLKLKKRIQKTSVHLAMRYQEPSIAQALDEMELAQLDELRVLPLYPQFASSSTQTAEVKVRRELKKRNFKGRLKVLKPFFDYAPFLKAQAEQGRSLWQSGRYDFVLFSFHGVPERQITRLKPADSDCLAQPACCDHPGKNLEFCYRAQAYANARQLASLLGLAEDVWSVSFQSRLGRTPWIRPYTDEVLPTLSARGLKRVLVFCPSFVADCLETLEEIALRERQNFLEKGGQELTLVPSLNDSDLWIEALEQMSNDDSRFRDVSL